MTVSTTLHTITADVSAWIATGEAPGREKLEILRRNLTAAATDARRSEAGELLRHRAAEALVDAVDRGVADIAGLARRTREQLGEIA